jgi:hypothetical protein
MCKNISCIINFIIVSVNTNLKFNVLPQCYFFSYCLFFWHFCFMCVIWQQTHFIHLFNISLFSVSLHLLYNMFPTYPCRGLTLIILGHFPFGFMFRAFGTPSSIPQLCPHILFFVKARSSNYTYLVWVVSCGSTIVPCVMKITIFFGR